MTAPASPTGAPSTTRRLALVLALAAAALVLPDRHGITTVLDAGTATRMHVVENYVNYDRWSMEDVLCRIYSGRYEPVDLSYKDGRPMLQKAPGLSWLAVPVYGASQAVRGERLPTHWAMWFHALLLIFLPGLVVAGALGRRWVRQFGPRAGLTAVAVMLLASPLATYLLVFLDYGLSAMLIAGGALLLRRDAPWSWGLGGAVLGLAGDVTYSMWLVGALVGALELVRRAGSGKRPVAFALWTVGGALLPLAGLLLYNDQVWGSPWLMSYSDAFVEWERYHTTDKVEPVASMLGRSFFDPRFGLLFWMPWVAFGVYGIWLMARDPDPDVRWDGVVVGLVALTIAVVAVVWTAKNKGDYAFNRHMVPAVPWLAWGFAAFLARRRAWLARPGAASVLIALVALSLLYQLATIWVMPFHDLRLDNPLWDFSVPMFLNGIHTPTFQLDPDALPLPTGAGPSDSFGHYWPAVGLTVVATAAAFGVAHRAGGAARGVATPGPSSRVMLPVYTLGLLAVLVFVSAPVTLTFGDDGPALAHVDRSQSDMAKLVAHQRTPEIAYSGTTPDDGGWDEAGHHGGANRWCTLLEQTPAPAP